MKTQKRRSSQFESLESRRLLTSVTVVVHGAAPQATLDNPAFDIERLKAPEKATGTALYNYFRTNNPNESVAVETYIPSTGALTLKTEETYCPGQTPCLNGPFDNKIILFDWGRKAADIAGGFDEAAGEALFVMLGHHELLDSDYLHMIGASRGGPVVPKQPRG